MADDMHSPLEAVKAFVRSMQERGLDSDTIMAAVLALPDVGNSVTNGVTNGITYNAKKQAEYRARKKAAAVTGVTNALPIPLPTRTRAGGVVSSSTKVDSGKKDKKANPTEAELRAALETVLDPEHAAAVVEHRQRGKSPMKTIQGAKALAGKFAKCPDPNSAADTMLAHGWRGIEPSWLPDEKPADSEVLYKFSTVKEGGYG